MSLASQMYNRKKLFRFSMIVPYSKYIMALELLLLILIMSESGLLLLTNSYDINQNTSTNVYLLHNNIQSDLGVNESVN